MSDAGRPLGRRAFLAALAGAPLLACARGVRQAAITGSIVGPSREMGHRLRERQQAEPASWEEVPVLIAGGGVAGLAAAWAFDRAGFSDFVQVELESTPGGTAMWGRNEVSAFPWGAHYVPTPDHDNRALVTLLEEVGAVEGYDGPYPVWAEAALCRAPQERLFHAGAWREGLYPEQGARPGEIAQLEAFAADMQRWAEHRDAAGRRAFRVPRALGFANDDVRALDERSMARYLDEHGYDSARLRWIVEYACLDDFGSTLEQTSAWAGVHYHASRIDPNTGISESFLTWPEGNGRLVRHLVEGVGSRLRTGQLVLRAEPDDAGVAVKLLDTRTGKVRGVRARQVVMALPRFVVGRVITPWSSDPPEHLAEAVYTPWIVANLTLRDRPQEIGFAMAWDNVIHGSRSLGYVVATHQTGRDVGPTVWTWYRPFPDDDPASTRRRLEAMSWEDCVTEILDDLRPAHPDIDRLVQHIDIMIWAHAMVRPRPGYLFSEALRRSAEPLGSIHFAHTDLSGLPLFEEAWYWGIRAAEAVLAARGRAVEAWYPA